MSSREHVIAAALVGSSVVVLGLASGLGTARPTANPGAGISPAAEIVDGGDAGPREPVALGSEVPTGAPAALDVRPASPVRNVHRPPQPSTRSSATTLAVARSPRTLSGSELTGAAESVAGSPSQELMGGAGVPRPAGTGTRVASQTLQVRPAGSAYGPPSAGSPAYGGPSAGSPSAGSPAYGPPSAGSPAYGGPSAGSPAYAGATPASPVGCTPRQAGLLGPALGAQSASCPSPAAPAVSR